MISSVFVFFVFQVCVDKNEEGMEKEDLDLCMPICDQYVNTFVVEMT